MSRNTLKLPGVIITWGCYLLLLYSLMATYISGISSLVGRTLQNCLGISPHAASVHLAVITLLPIIYKVRIIDQVNRLFSIIGILCFGFLIFSLASHVDNSYLTRYSLNQLSYSLPVLVTSFGFHIVIPILVRYLDRDVAALRYCIFIGSLIPLFIYGIWQLSVMGSIPPEGGYGMSEIIRSPDQLNSLIEAITFVTKNMYIEIAFSLLSAFVILTSFIGVGISLWDFLSDGLSHTPRWTNNAISLTVATIGPPLCLVLWFPKAFSELLSYAGVFVSILLGLLPIAMCWKGRKRSTWGKEYLTPGGKGALILSALFFFYVALVELFF